MRAQSTAWVVVLVDPDGAAVRHHERAGEVEADRDAGVVGIEVERLEEGVQQGRVRSDRPRAPPGARPRGPRGRSRAGTTAAQGAVPPATHRSRSTRRSMEGSPSNTRPGPSPPTPSSPARPVTRSPRTRHSRFSRSRPSEADASISTSTMRSVIRSRADCTRTIDAAISSTGRSASSSIDDPALGHGERRAELMGERGQEAVALTRRLGVGAVGHLRGPGPHERPHPPAQERCLHGVALGDLHRRLAAEDLEDRLDAWVRRLFARPAGCRRTG